MMCNAKTMLKFGLGLLAVLAVLFAAVPEVRSWIITSGPLLVFLLCPLHMVYCMLTMKKKPAETTKTEPKALPLSDKQEA